MKKSSQDYLNDQMSGRYSPQPFPFISPFTTYHEMTTAEYSPQIELDPANGLSLEYRDTVTVEGDGSVTEAAGEFLASTGATANSTAMLSTKERGRYQSGIMGLAGHSVRRPVSMTGDQEIWWEYGDGIDGVRVGEDSTGAYVRFISAGSLDDKIYQSDWNRDTLTGEGGSANPSGATLDLTRQVTFRHPFSHYGVGPIQVAVYMVDDSGYPIYVLAHEFTGSPGQILFSDPKLPLREYASNGTTGGDVELFIGGREFAVLGRYDPVRRPTSDFFTQVDVADGVRTPLLSFRKKNLRKWIARSVKISGFSLESDNNILIEIFINATLTGASFSDISDIDPSETAMQSDKSATAMSGGVRVDGWAGAGGRSDQGMAGIDALGFDIPDNAVITLAATGNGLAATVSGFFKVEEEA